MAKQRIGDRYRYLLKRRDLVAMAGGAALASLFPAFARAATMPTIGWLVVGSAARASTAPFYAALHDMGFVEGRDFTRDERFADGEPARLPALAAEMVERKVSIILATSGICVRAAMAATKTIPIVGLLAGDPVQAGLIQSFNHPGGNVTGVFLPFNGITLKQVEFMHDLLAPKLDSIALLTSSDMPDADNASIVHGASVTAEALGNPLVVIKVAGESDFEPAFAKFGRQQVTGIVVVGTPLNATHLANLTALAARYSIPAIYWSADVKSSGALMSYGPDYDDMLAQFAQYVMKILHGEKPDDLPVEQPSQIPLKLNLITAKALGITVPTALLVRADEVIE